MQRIYALMAGIALLVTSAAGQDAGADKRKAELDELQKMVATSKMMAANGGVMGRTVKGAPYSGEEVNENSQVLTDGTRIHNETRATVYRDSYGRVRRETGDLVIIWDPVANVNYMLNPKNMTAEKSPMPPAIFEKKFFTAKVAGESGGPRSSGTVSVKDGVVTYTKDGKAQTFPMPASGQWVSEDGKARVSHMTSGAAVAGPGTPGFVVREGDFTIVTSEGKAGALPVPPDGRAIFENRVHIASPAVVGMAIAGGDFGAPMLRTENANFKNESLDDQFIEGVKSRGTRMTSTIPEGAIGNDRPLNSITERWYSDELQTDLVTRRTDPRSGEQTFRLININRSEPAAYLFQVPSNYTLIDRN